VNRRVAPTGRAGGSRDARRRHGGRRDQGSAAIELAILAPVLLALLALVIAAGRASIAQNSIAAAARDAARQASIALTPAAAQKAALASARSALADDGLDCAPIVTVDTTGFGATPGEPATPVKATVTCIVPLSQLALPGLPGSARLTSTFSSPIDLYRQR
jgi:Flp pilus assembly protein TadG